MAEEIDFEIGHFRKFDVLVTLTLTSDELENHIIEKDLSTSTNTSYWLVAIISSLIVDGRTDIFSLIV